MRALPMLARGILTWALCCEPKAKGRSWARPACAPSPVLQVQKNLQEIPDS